MAYAVSAPWKTWRLIEPAHNEAEKSLRAQTPLNLAAETLPSSGGAVAGISLIALILAVARSFTGLF